MSRESAGERSQLLIRAASENDVETILSFIQELAEYEQLAHLVEADAETLHATLFSDTRYAEVVIAECDTRPAGFALFFHSYSTWRGRPGLYLEDLFVPEEHRGAGHRRATSLTLGRTGLSTSLRPAGIFSAQLERASDRCLRETRRTTNERLDDVSVQRARPAPTGEPLPGKSRLGIRFGFSIAMLQV